MPGKKTKVTEPAAAVAPAEPSTKKRQSKKVPVPPSPPPVAVIPQPAEEVPVETVREIKVHKREIDGRNLYLGPKDKVYDLKFKYLGRLKEEKLVAFPDSDEGM